MVQPVDFRIDAYLRQNQPTGPPTLTKLGPMGTDAVDLTQQLNGVDELRFTVQPDTLEDDIRVALRTAVSTVEAWLYLDAASTPIFAGPVVGLAPTAAGASVLCRGLLHYLNAGQVAADVTYTDTDLAVIVKGLIDDWQGRGRHFGLVTAGIAALGVTGTHTYLAAEHDKVLRRVADLAAGHFDYRVNPATRAFELAAAHGTDLTGAVVIDRRNVVDPGATVSADWDDVAAVVYARGTGPDGAEFSATATNTATLATYGRIEASVSWSDVQTQAELDVRAADYAQARAAPLFVPSLNLVPVADAGVADFTVGDTVTHRFDYGFGEISGPQRVGTRKVAADRRSGATAVSVAFL